MEIRQEVGVTDIIMPYLKQVRDFLRLELADFKRLEGSNLDQVKSAYGIDGFTGEIYYTDLNLVLTHENDYEVIQHMVTGSDVVFRLEIPEYTQYLLVIRYHQDILLSQILSPSSSPE